MQTRSPGGRIPGLPPRAGAGSFPNRQVSQMVTSFSRFFDALRCGAVVCAFVSVICPAVAGADWFEDVAADAGIEFSYDNGMEGNFYFPEIMGGGAALFDYDNDGLLDLYLVQAGAIGPGIGPEDREQGDRLYRNVSSRDAGGRWVVRFSDVTEQAGIDARGYGMGVAVGDYSGNGYADIYVLNFGDNQLWRNNGDGTFTDATAEVGVNDARWSVSGSFADYDGDGQLDLMLVNYADYDFDRHRECLAAGSSRQDYCSPSAYEPAGDRLFRNLGDGRFRDVTGAAGLAGSKSHGLGVISADLDADGRTDIYVANDGSANFYWRNQGDLRFDNDALLAGNAVNAGGAAEAGMGVDAADYDHSGSEDIFISHLKRETNTLYRNSGEGWFSDVTSASGLGAPSLPYTGFGTAWADIDNDGRLDLVVVNGAVTEEEALATAGDPFPYHQNNQIFIGNGNGRFTDATKNGGAPFAASRVSRGAAFGDIDNDGRMDIVVVNVNASIEVLLNRIDRGHHWLGLDPVCDGRHAAGVRAWLIEDDAPEVLRRSRTDGSYASAHDRRILFGLGPDNRARDIRVQWPDGSMETFAGLGVGQYHEIIKGKGE